MNLDENLNQQHILVVDDDADIRDLLAKFLAKYGYEVTVAANGEEMFAVLAKTEVDLIILDIMMPGEDGVSLCERLRKDSHIPVIMLSAMSDDSDRIVGLEIGADDYIPKPFNPRELVARVKAVLRRSEANIIEEPTQGDNYALKFATWTLLVNKRSLLSDSKIEFALSTGEYDLLMAFLENPQKILSRDQLLDYTKNRIAGPFDRSIDMQVSRLRQKIELNPKNPDFIKTIRGGGYMFTAQVKKVTCR